jgi:hypothetical protein
MSVAWTIKVERVQRRAFQERGNTAHDDEFHVVRYEHP